MEINNKRLNELVRAAIIVKGTSLASESEALGWSKNRLGQCLNEATSLSRQIVFNICKHFELPLEEVVSDAGNTMAYMPMGHLLSDSGIAYGRRRYYKISGITEIYVDSYVTVRVPQGTLQLYPGARLRVAETTEIVEGNSYAVAKRGEPFEILEWFDVRMEDWDLIFVLTSIGLLQEPYRGAVLGDGDGKSDSYRNQS